VIVPGAVYRRTVTNVLIGINSTLTRITSAMLSMGDQAFDFLHPDHKLAESWAVSYAGEDACLVRFNGLCFNTGFNALLADGNQAVMLVPSFAAAGVQKRLWWVQPPDSALWMLICDENTYLVLARSAPFDGALWNLPCPNVFPDGRICMGRDFARLENVRPHQDVERRVQHLMDSSWNSDLAPDLRKAQAVFQWNDHEKQIEVPLDVVLANSTVIMNNELSALILGVSSDA
jgi:hypothetical protein